VNLQRTNGHKYLLPTKTRLLHKSVLPINPKRSKPIGRSLGRVESSSDETLENLVKKGGRIQALNEKARKIRHEEAMGRADEKWDL